MLFFLDSKVIRSGIFKSTTVKITTFSGEHQHAIARTHPAPIRSTLDLELSPRSILPAVRIAVANCKFEGPGRQTRTIDRYCEVETFQLLVNLRGVAAEACLFTLMTVVD